MAKSQPANVQRAAPRLYLVTPEIGETATFAGAIRQAIEADQVAAVLLRLKPAAERDLINRVKTLAEVVQRTDTALVLDGYPEIAARGGADGAHLTGIENFTAAVDNLKPARIAGCGGLHTRHDAMVAGERGADYAMFGEPEPNGRRPSFEAIIERAEWWARLFEIPCVAFAAEMDEIAPLAKTGADFVAIGGSIWDDPRGPAAAVAEAVRRLNAPEAVP